MFYLLLEMILCFVQYSVERSEPPESNRRDQVIYVSRKYSRQQHTFTSFRQLFCFKLLKGSYMFYEFSFIYY